MQLDFVNNERTLNCSITCIEKTLLSNVHIEYIKHCCVHRIDTNSSANNQP